MMAFLNAPGFFGTRATMRSDLTLVLTVLTAVLFTIGWRLAVGKRYEAHRWVQTAAVILNTAIVLILMVTSYVTYILPGVRSIFSTKRPIEKIEDAKGLKIRSMQSPVYIDMFKNMGMLPTPMPSSELYTSLQTGVVDAGENDPASVVSWGWVDVIKYYSLNEHSISCNVMMMNKKKMDSLPPDIQKAIRAAGKTAENYQLDYIQKALAENLEKIKAKGVKVNVITDKKPFQDAVKDIIAKYEPEIGKDLIQTVRDAAKK